MVMFTSQREMTSQLAHADVMGLRHPDAILQGDVLKHVLGYLPWRQVVHCRSLSKSWLKAVSETSVALVDVYQQLDVARLAHALPHLQSLRIHHSARVRDQEIVGLLSRLCYLKEIELREARALQHSFVEIRQLKQLQRLNLHNNAQLEWNLESVGTDLPNLTDLRCINNRRLRGKLLDLIELPGLEVLDVSGCRRVTGNWLDLSHLPNLRWLGLSRTEVNGDLRDLQPQHFPSLQLTGLGEQVYGARTFHLVSDAPQIMQSRHQLTKQSQEDIPLFPFQVGLSETSQDYHERIEQRLYQSDRDPPFNIENVQAGVRRGWRWSNYLGGVCDIHWLDEEPTDRDAFEDYLVALAQVLNESAESIFLGFLNPPTPSEYAELCQQR